MEKPIVAIEDDSTLGEMLFARQRQSDRTSSGNPSMSIQGHARNESFDAGSGE